MVIFAAVGGRMSLVGAVYGTLLVNAGKTYFSESFPDLWLFLMAALFIGVMMAFPMGWPACEEATISAVVDRASAAPSARRRASAGRGARRAPGRSPPVRPPARRPRAVARIALTAARERP